MTRKNGLFRPVDMTVGEPWKQIVIFMIPLLIGNVVQQLYNTVDSIVVGRFLGDDYELSKLYDASFSHGFRAASK